MGADLGVLYNSTNNNTVSPQTLTIDTFKVNSALTILYANGGKAASIDSNSNLVSSTETSAQQGYLALMIQNTNLINLGLGILASGAGNPTNGVMSTNRTLYLNTQSTNFNDTAWLNQDTNWYRLSSTNGGSINESQLNFTDVTTADATTNQHGLLIKLAGNTNLFLRSDGTWNSAYVLTPAAGLASPKPILIVDPTVVPGSTNTVNYYDTAFNYFNGTLNVTNIVIGSLFGGTAARLLGATDSAVIVGDLQATSMQDNTVGNATTGHHGFAPKGDGNANHFLDGTLNWSTPGGGSGAVGITGTPVTGQVTYWTGTNTVAGDSGMTYDPVHQALTVGRIIPSVYDVPTASSDSQLTSGTYTPTRISLAGQSTTSGTVDIIQHYIRIGNEITVSGKLQMARVGSAAVSFYVSLPMATSGPVSPSEGGLAGHGIVTDSTGTIEIGSVVIYALGGSPTLAVFQSQGSSTVGTIRNFYYSFTYTTN